MPDKTERAERYRNKAEEARNIAESTKDAQAREFLMSVSADYIMLARLMEHITDPLPAGD